MLQPFVENAIWHGLHPKQNQQGELSIDLRLSGELLDCRISDNGVGRSRLNGHATGDDGPAKRSLGIKLTQNRLDLFESSLRERKAVISISDLTDDKGGNAGTSVLIRMPVKTVEIH